jgi:hypothetical protein
MHADVLLLGDWVLPLSRGDRVLPPCWVSGSAGLASLKVVLVTLLWYVPSLCVLDWSMSGAGNWPVLVLGRSSSRVHIAEGCSCHVGATMSVLGGLPTCSAPLCSMEVGVVGRDVAAADGEGPAASSKEDDGARADVSDDVSHCCTLDVTP